MPKTITQYVCPICDTIYLDYNEAMNCEMAGIPPQQFYEGDAITYEDESSMMGVRWSYSMNSGIVLAVLTRSYNDNGIKRHIKDYVVRYNGYQEALVVSTPQGYKSFAEGKYTPGFADDYKHHLQRIRNQSY